MIKFYRNLNYEMYHFISGVLECNSIPQFEESEVDAIFENLHYEDEGI